MRTFYIIETAAEFSSETVFFPPPSPERGDLSFVLYNTRKDIIIIIIIFKLRSLLQAVTNKKQTDYTKLRL